MFSSTNKCIESECLVFFVNLVVKNLATKYTSKSTIGHNEYRQTWGDNLKFSLSTIHVNL